MTSYVTDEDIISFNNDSLKSSTPISPPDHCHFTNLHPNVELEILKLLEYREYLNLARTCRHWYQTAVSAPRSMKPVIPTGRIHMNKDRLVTDGLFSAWIKMDVNTFKLVNKFKCCELVGFEEFSSDWMRFILLNRSYFEFELISIGGGYATEPAYMNEENCLLLDSFFDLASSFYMNCDLMNELFIVRFLEKHLSNSCLSFDNLKSAECLNLILKQWVKGERPKLKKLDSFNLMADIQDLDDIIQGLEEFVRDKLEDNRGNFSAKFVVPGLPDLLIRGRNEFSDDDGEQTITFALSEV